MDLQPNDPDITGPAEGLEVNMENRTKGGVRVDGAVRRAKRQCGDCIWWSGELALGECKLVSGIHFDEKRWNTTDACANYNDPRPIIEAEKAHRERVKAMEQVDA